MGLKYLKTYNADTGDYISFPIGRFKYNANKIDGYYTHVFETADLAAYAGQIAAIAVKIGVVEQVTKNLYFFINDAVTMSYVSISKNSRGYSLGFHIYNDSASEYYSTLYSDVFYPIGDFGYEQEYGIPCKFIDDSDNHIQTRSPYTATNVENFFVFYDDSTGRIKSARFFSGQPHYATLVTAPNLIDVLDLDGGGYILGITAFDDPNTQGGTSSEGGGSGTFNNSSDGNDFPNAPSLSPVDAGFITLYNPTNAELKSLATYMWSGLFDPASFRKLFADPMDAILGLSIVPVAVPDGLSTEVKVGNIGTGIYMTRAGATFVTVDCGTISLEEYWGNALDYAPNTKLTIYLPYIGFRQIDVDETMAKSISVKYEVDILTGACVCWVRTQTSDGKNFIAYTYEGNCAVQVPITSNDWSNVISSTIKAVGSVVGMVATSGASAGVQAGAVAAGITNTTNAVMNSKPTVSRSGSFSGSGGQMNIQVPFLVLERPRQSLPQNYNKFGGYPSNIYTASLGSLKGYTEVESIHLEGINATDSELSEIESLLKGGVIL